MDHSAEAERKRLERRERKLAQENKQRQPHPASLFLQRPWIPLSPPAHAARIHARPLRVMTWNLLAQCLVRSELFPTSGKARKASQRVPMLHAEILSHDADVLCMQEVDGLDKLLPALDLAGYAYSYASGPDKPHGCLIAYKHTLFRIIHEAAIEYDKLEARNNLELSARARIGSSRQTKNVANIVALQSIDQARGYIVATTHLFWHPMFTYERARQAGLLVREVLAFREHWRLHDWPCILAGDFNFSPDDPAYSLLVGEPLSFAQRERLRASRVVHVSIDPFVPTSVTKEREEGADEEQDDPDRVIQNSRNSQPSDGLLSDTELSGLVGHCLRSAYDDGQRSSLLEGRTVATYGTRSLLPAEKAGACEPMWTSFTHYWKTTLDYIFILDAPGHRTDVMGYLQPHRIDDVARGLPQIGICGSDHFSLCAQLVTLPTPLQ